MTDHHQINSQIHTDIGMSPYLIPGLCLSNENKSIGGDDREAEIYEDD